MPSINIHSALSLKIKNVMFFCMLLVVILHASAPKLNMVGFVHNGMTLKFIQAFLGEGITRIAVPAFFIMSGFLFFVRFDGTWSNWKAKLRSRMKGLLVPYLIWSGLGVVLILLLNSNSVTHSLVNRELPATDFSTILYIWLVDPVNYQFWFVRDLIVMVVCCTIPLYFLNRIHVLLALGVVISTVFFVQYLPFQRTSLLYYSIGVSIAFSYEQIVRYKVSNLWLYSITLFWLISCVVKAYDIVYSLQLFPWWGMEVFNFLGCLSVWLIWGKLKLLHSNPMWKYSGFSFFVFAFHEPLLTSIKKVIFLISHSLPFHSWLIFVLSPILCVIISIAFAKIMLRNVPKTYSLLSGNRS